MCIQLAKICLGRSASCFIYSFKFCVISEKTLCSEYFTRTFERQFYMEKNCNYDSYKFAFKNQLQNCFYIFFVHSQAPKTRITFSGSWWQSSSNKTYFCILFIASRNLLQTHVKFNRLLSMNFLPCYFCLYSTSIIKSSFDENLRQVFQVDRYDYTY